MTTDPRQGQDCSTGLQLEQACLSSVAALVYYLGPWFLFLGCIPIPSCPTSVCLYWGLYSMYKHHSEISSRALSVPFVYPFQVFLRAQREADFKSPFAFGVWRAMARPRSPGGIKCCMESSCLLVFQKNIDRHSMAEHSFGLKTISFCNGWFGLQPGFTDPSFPVNDTQTF